MSNTSYPSFKKTLLTILGIKALVLSVLAGMYWLFAEAEQPAPEKSYEMVVAEPVEPTVREPVAEPEPVSAPSEQAASAGTPVDPLAGLRALAESGNAQAQYDLGITLFNGDGVETTPQEGLHWLEVSASNGHMDAHMFLAMLYDQGNAVEPDAVKAASYYALAGEAGNVDALFLAGNLYYERQGFGAELTERAMDHKAYNLLLRAAKQGHARAQFLVGSIYQNGNTHVNPNEAQAFAWFKKSALQGDHMGQRDLGSAYFHGQGTGQDLEQAAFWHVQAAEQGSVLAAQYLQREAEAGIELAAQWIRANGRVPLD